MLTDPLVYEAERSPRVPLPPGAYQARIYYGGLDSIRDPGCDLQGDDHYRVVLWPGTRTRLKVLKRKPVP